MKMNTYELKEKQKVTLQEFLEWYMDQTEQACDQPIVDGTRAVVEDMKLSLDFWLSEREV